MIDGIKTGSLRRIGIFTVSVFMFRVNSSAQLIDSKERFLSAASLDRIEIVRDYLQGGGNPNAVNADGESALLIAIREGSEAVTAALLGTAALEPNLRSSRGETALMLAAHRGDAKVVGALLDRGARVNQPGWTALHYAAIQGHAGIVARLVERKATVDALAPGDITPLMLAARRGSVESVRALLNAGADDRRVSDRGLRAVDFATNAGHTALADALRERESKAATKR